MRNFDSKKDLILDAALKAAIQKGTSNVTVREVAKSAGVNVAAINYYFSSKHQMLKSLDRLFWDNFNEAFKKLDRTDKEAEEKLLDWMVDALSYAVHYPGIVVILREKFASPKTAEDIAYRDKLYENIGKVRKLFNEVVGCDEADKKLFTMFSSAVLWPYLALPFVIGEVPSFASHKEMYEFCKFNLDFYKNKNFGGK